MRIRSMLLSTVLCGGVIAISGIANAAPLLKPQGSWAVTKVDGKQPGATPYCALARRFGNGSIVTFARNTFNETSVAVDFPPGSFKSDQDYTVVLDPGVGESRSYKTKPVSQRGIVIRMGRDDKFYEALEQTGKLGINVADQAFDFAMADVKAGTEDLSACLGTSIEPAAGGDSVKEAAAPVAAPTPTPPPAPMAMAAPIPPVSAGDVEAVKEENIRLRNALERERRSYEDKMQSSEGTSANAELSEKVQLLQKENAELKSQVVTSSAAKVPAPVVLAAPVVACAPAKPDDTTLNLLRAENSQIKTELEAQKKRVALAPDETMVNSLRTENSQIKSELEAQKKRIALAPDDAQVNSLKSENIKLKAEIEADKKKLAMMTPGPIPSDSAEIGTLRAENNQLKSDIADQKQKVAALEAAQKTAANTKADTSGAEASAAAALAQVSAMKEQVVKLQGENQSLKSILDTRQATAESTPQDMKVSVATIARMKGMEEQMALLRAERDKLSGQIETMSKTSGDGRLKISSDNWNLEQATERFNQAELEIRRLGSVVEQERAKCSVEKKNIEYMLFDPKIANKEQVAKLVNLENQLADAKEQGGSEKLAAADKNIQDLKAQLATSTDQMAQMKKSLDEASNAKVASAAQTENVDALKQQLASATDQISQLKKNLDDATQAKVAANDQTQIIDSLKQEIASLNNQAANVQTEKTATAEKLGNINPASGGDDSRDAVRLSPAANTVVPRPTIEVSSEALDAPGGVAAANGAPTPIMPPSVKQLPTTIAAAPVQSIDSAAQVSNVKLMAQGDIDGLLHQAGVALTAPVQSVASATSPGRVTYRWETGGMFGTAEQKPMEAATQYDRYVQDYLDKTKSRCNGQFAAVPGMVDMTGGSRISSYEIACVNEKSGDGASAALVFYSQGSTFTTIAHESSAESMDMAMDARDKIVAVVDSSKTASR